MHTLGHLNLRGQRVIYIVGYKERDLSTFLLVSGFIKCLLYGLWSIALQEQVFYIVETLSSKLKQHKNFITQPSKLILFLPYFYMQSKWHRFVICNRL